MAWVKVPPENHPIFYDALPKSRRVETLKMFGGVAAKVNGHFFAGLFGRSTMVQLAEPDRAAALALEGAGLFDPMGDGRVRSDKVMLPESMMEDPEELRAWIGRAFETAAALPKKVEKASRTRPAVRGREGTTSKKPVGKKPAAKSLEPTRSLKRK
jgi:TfoX N-terminal domain